jgi:hypothetical protein
MNKTNRLGWTVEFWDVNSWRVVTKYGAEVDGKSYTTEEEAQKAIDAEIKKRDKRNLRSLFALVIIRTFHRGNEPGQGRSLGRASDAR